MPGPYRVAVVGCGVAGATTAHLLARDGHAVTVLERAAVLGPVGAGVLLQPSGQAVLRRLGVLDSVVAHAAPVEELHARHADGGTTLVRTRYADDGPGLRAYGVHRGVLFHALLDLVTAGRADVRTGCDVVGREECGDGIVLTDACGRRHGPFDFAVAGDGSRSRFRAACRLPARVTNYSHGTLWITGPASAVTGRLLQVVRGNRYLFGMLPLGDGLASLYWGVPVREYDAVRRRGLAALKRDVLAFAPEAAELLGPLTDVDGLLFTTYRAVHMPRWFDRHTLFLGDSCHAMSPHLGQGINIALVDAVRFADCLRTAPDPPAAFRAFHRAQRAYVRYYATLAGLLSPFFQGDWPVLGWGRDWALPWLPRVPWVRRRMARTAAGLVGGFLGGPVDIGGGGE